MGTPLAYLSVIIVGLIFKLLHPISLIEILISTAFATFLLVLFVQRKKSFVTWEYVYIADGLVIRAVSKAFTHEPSMGIFVALVEFIFIGLYSLRSKRVKKTFVR